jgi:riboflavin transporter FmnP
MHSANSGAGEVLRTVGLLLNFAAIIAFALFLSTLGGPVSSRSYLAAAIAVATFIASLLFLAADPQRDEGDLDQSSVP